MKYLLASLLITLNLSMFASSEVSINENFDIPTPSRYGSLNYLPDLSRISLRDFGLNPYSPVNQLSITIESGDIEPDINCEFNKDGRLTRFYMAYDGQIQNYRLRYDSDGKIASVIATDYWERDDTSAPVVTVLYTFTRENGRVMGIKEKILSINNKLYDLPEVTYAVIYDSYGKVSEVRCIQYPEVFWKRHGDAYQISGYVWNYVIPEGEEFIQHDKEIEVNGEILYISDCEVSPALIYNDTLDEETYHPTDIKLWDSSLIDYYSWVGEDKLERIEDPYNNWYQLNWDGGEDYGHQWIKRDIVYFGDQYKGNLRGILDWDKTHIEDFHYGKDANIKTLTLYSWGDDDGETFVYEFDRKGRVVSKYLYDNLGGLVMDQTKYFYGNEGLLSHVVNRYIPEIFSGDHELYDINDFNCSGIATPMITSRCDFYWEGNRVTGIKEQILEINDMPISYLPVHYNVKYYSDGKVCEISCVENPLLGISVSPEGNIIKDNGYFCEYAYDADFEMLNDCAFKKERIQSSECEYVYIPLKVIPFKWSFRSEILRKYASGRNYNGSLAPWWDYNNPDFRGNLKIEERDLKGNWTRMSWDSKIDDYGGKYGVEAEIEYY